MRNLFLSLCLLMGTTCASEAQVPHIKVHNKVLHHINPKLFGQFLERASWGEPGPEGIVEENGQLPEDVMELLQRLSPPLIRFPGGTDVDHIDWMDMIDNAPGRNAKERPITTGQFGGNISNRYGYHEYFETRDRLGCETIIVINLLDGLIERKPLEEAARHSAGLVAYCNAKLGSPLPDGMPNWPEIRTKNGHPAPFNAEFIQLGNEWWCGKFQKMVLKLCEGDKDKLAQRFITTLHAYIKAIRAVDPDVPLIIDAKMPARFEGKVLSDPFIKQHVKYACLHAYGPMGKPPFTRNGQNIPDDEISHEDIHWRLSSMPGAYNEQGTNLGIAGPRIDMALELGYRIAATEWNWNGWGFDKYKKSHGFDWHDAASIGTASMWQALMNQGDVIELATQSLLLGCGWDIAAIKYNARDSKNITPIHFGAQGQTSLFYKDHHGDRVCQVTQSNITTRQTTLGITYCKEGSYTKNLEALATRDDQKLYVHVVHREPISSTPIHIDLSDYSIAQQGIHWALLPNNNDHDSAYRFLHEQKSNLPRQGSLLKLQLPPSSIHCFEFQLR